MGILGWMGGHWLDLLQTTSILVGFFTGAYTIRINTKERKIGNLFALTNAHRELWSRLYERKELLRVLADSVNLRREPITAEEELFVHTLILHLRAAFKARHLGMQFDDDAVAADIRQFFTRPIPRTVWKRSKVFQDRDFVDFVDRCIEPLPVAKRAA
jgi:ligand-binding SRPBCC domain-containing protein